MRVISTGLPLLITAAVVVLTQKPACSSTIFNFEGFPDSTVLSTQYIGLSFSNAIILSAGITLNEFEFPPHSGTNVASDNGGPITITFSPPVQSFSAYFTYTVPLTLQAFSSGTVQIAVATSQSSNNEALSGAAGSQPNELMQVAAAGGIVKVVITGAPAGTSFTLDDITATSFSPCDINQDSHTNVADVQLMINEALGVNPAVNDLNGGGVVNVVDVQIVINAALGLGCVAK